MERLGSTSLACNIIIFDLARYFLALIYLIFSIFQWRVVRLKNSRIYDWSLFSSHIRRAGTQHLDMRKMLFVTSPEETWSNLERTASNLSEILRIELCKCPSEVLESITKHCSRLQYIDAQFIRLFISLLLSYIYITYS